MRMENLFAKIIKSNLRKIKIKENVKNPQRCLHPTRKPKEFNFSTNSATIWDLEWTMLAIKDASARYFYVRYRYLTWLDDLG